MNKYQDFKHRKTLNSLSNLPLIRSSGELLSPIYKSIDFDNLTTISRWPDLIQLTCTKSASHSKIQPKRKPAISEYSIKQNDLVNSFLSPLLIERAKSINLPEISPNSSKLTDSNFNRLIDTINEITSPRISSSSNPLSEGEITEIQIPKGKFRYFWCVVKGKKPPLSLKIKKKLGKVQVFYSSTMKQPDHNHCDKQYASDYIEIRDFNQHFRHEFAYLGIFGLEESDLQLSLTFGKTIGSLAELKKIKMDLKLITSANEYSDSSDSESKRISPQKLKNAKNFIKHNKIAQLQNFNAKLSILTERAESWKVKHEQIIIKKKSILNFKKQRTLELVNKKMHKKEREKSQKIEKMLKDRKIRFYGIWMTFNYFAKSIERIRNYIEDSKAYKAHIDLLITKVQLIQKIYRKFKGNSTSNHTVLLRSRNLLSLYSSNRKQLELKFLSGKIIFNFISVRAHTHLVFHHFARFQSSVFRIQRCFRRYYSRKERRLIELRKLWDQACEQILFKKATSKAKRQELSSILIAIPSNIRDTKLLELYKRCIKLFRRESNVIDSSIKTFTQNKIFQTAISGFMLKSEFLDFAPSSRQLENMIESLLQEKFN